MTRRKYIPKVFWGRRGGGGSRISFRVTKRMTQYENDNGGDDRAEDGLASGEIDGGHAAPKGVLE